MPPRNTTPAETDPPTSPAETDPPTSPAETDPPTSPAETDPPTSPPADPVPSLGRMVLVLGEVACHNGADVAPGMITRVWGEHPDGGHTVNVTVFPDYYMPRHATSVRLHADEQAARESLNRHRGAVAAYWPPRV